MIGGVKPVSLYGATMITGDFGAGKTFGLGAELYMQKEKNPNICLIANMPRSITDIYYNSFTDFCNVLDHLYNFFESTNNDLTNYDQYKDIIFVMDESQLYFPARESMNKERRLIWNKLMIVLTQCRKRQTKFWFCTQRSQTVDINFRRLADYIWFYRFNRVFGLPVNRINIFQAGGGLADLVGEDGTTWETVEQLKESQVYSGIGKHNTVYFRKELRLVHNKWGLRKEKHLTNHICGLIGDIYNLSQEEFVEKLLKTEKTVVPIVSYYNRDCIPVFEFGKKYLDYKNKVIKTEI